MNKIKPWHVAIFTIVALIGFVIGYKPTRTARDAQEIGQENTQAIQQNTERLKGTVTIKEIRSIIATLERITGTRDAPPGEQGPQGPAGPDGGTPELPDPGRSPVPTIRDPFPQPTASPGTLKPALCMVVERDTLEALGIHCDRDTFVLCDLVKISCPAPPDPPSPSVPPPTPSQVPPDG